MMMGPKENCQIIIYSLNIEQVHRGVNIEQVLREVTVIDALLANSYNIVLIVSFMEPKLLHGLLCPHVRVIKSTMS